MVPGTVCSGLGRQLAFGVAGRDRFMPALLTVGAKFARPQGLKDFGAFLLPVWSAIGPHVPALRAGQPPRNHRVKVLHMLVVAARAFGPGWFAHAQRNDSVLCGPVLHDAATNII